MINLNDSMGGSEPMNNKKKLGYDMASFLEEAQDLYLQHAEQGGCPEGERMVFGVCRKIGGSGKNDFDSKSKTKQEKEIEAAAAKFKSDPKNNTKFTINGKSYGWAMKGGKPVAVEWGSVAGNKSKTKEKK